MLPRRGGGGIELGMTKKMSMTMMRERSGVLGLKAAMVMTIGKDGSSEESKTSKRISER